jgi:hypothetical protein
VIVTITNRIKVVNSSIVSREQYLFRDSKVPVKTKAGGPSFAGLNKMEDLFDLQRTIYTAFHPFMTEGQKKQSCQRGIHGVADLSGKTEITLFLTETLGKETV